MALRTGFGASTLSQAAAGERLPTLPVLLAYVEACDGDREFWQERWRQVTEEEAAEPRPDDTAAAPYRGLARFETHDEGLFFGRDRLTDELIRQVRSSRLTAVVGPSGSGKSSLLRAGLIPRLRRTGDNPDAQTSARHGTEPGLPLTAPASTRPSTPDAPPAAVRVLTPGSHPLRTHGSRLTPAETEPAGGETWLIVDQFEELYTLCHDTDERVTFIERLLAARKPDSRLRVVIAVRADFFGRVTEYPGLAKALQGATLLAAPMSTGELRQAIVKPAQEAGLIVERELTTRLLSEVEGEPGALPLMSHALLETWRRRRSRALTITAYEAAGGLHGAVAQTAENFYTELTRSQTWAARRLLLRLITPGEGTADTRRPADRAELLSCGPPSVMEPTLERLARARLITLDGTSVDLAHEALITAWPRLRGWIDEDRRRLRVQRQLTEAASTWEQLGRDDGALYRGIRLAEADDILAQGRHELTPTEHAFLTASSAEQTKGHRRLRHVLIGVSTALCLALIAAGAAVWQWRTAEDQQEVAAYRALVAEAGNLRTSQPQLALRLGLAAHRLHPSAETRRAVADTMLHSSFQGMTTLESGTEARGSVLSHNGRTLAIRAPGASSGVSLWDIAAPTRRTALAQLPDCPTSNGDIAFSGDDRTLIASCGTDRLVLYDVHEPRQPRRLTTLRTASSREARSPGDGSLALNHDGSVAASVTRGTVESWTVSAHGITKAPPDAWHATDVTAVDFLQDNRTAVVWSQEAADDRSTEKSDPEDEATLWDISAPLNPRKTTDPVSADRPLAFSPPSNLLVISNGGVLRTLDLAMPGERRSLSVGAIGHRQDITALAFSPDGKKLATGSFDRTVVLWDVTDPAAPKPTRTLNGNEAPITGLAFTPDGVSLVAVDTQQAVVRWSTSGRTSVEPVATLRDRRNFRTLSYTPDGKTLVTGGTDGVIALRDITDPAHPSTTATVKGHNGLVVGMAISPDGKILASSDITGLVQLWDITDRRRPRKAGFLQPAQKADSRQSALGLYPVDFAPYGAVLAVFDGKETDLYDVSTLDPQRLGATEGRLSFDATGRTAVAGRDVKDAHSLKDLGTLPLQFPIHSDISPDGRLVASTDLVDRTIVLADISQPDQPRGLGKIHIGEDGSLVTMSAKFHLKGDLLARLDSNNVATLYDTGDPSHPRTLGSLAYLATDLAFSPDGRYVATATVDGKAMLWDLGALPAISADPVTAACAAAHGGLTRDEWEEHIPGQPYRNSCR
ncbi:hypothetical protein AB0P17_41650 [Streptomyces sp. NPDC088124]|uniref:nSTAND1 domain-containing NTPase n=1 Tax=Streptomyces sp. NPDC088124 TaxID=3154654 RepID=UPI0034460C8B